MPNRALSQPLSFSYSLSTEVVLSHNISASRAHSPQKPCSLVISHLPMLPLVVSLSHRSEARTPRRRRRRTNGELSTPPARQLSSRKGEQAETNERTMWKHFNHMYKPPLSLFHIRLDAFKWKSSKESRKVGKNLLNWSCSIWKWLNHLHMEQSKQQKTDFVHKLITIQEKCTKSIAQKKWKAYAQKRFSACRAIPKRGPKMERKALILCKTT